MLRCLTANYGGESGAVLFLIGSLCFTHVSYRMDRIGSLHSIPLRASSPFPCGRRQKRGCRICAEQPKSVHFLFYLPCSASSPFRAAWIELARFTPFHCVPLRLFPAGGGKGGDAAFVRNNRKACIFCFICLAPLHLRFAPHRRLDPGGGNGKSRRPANLKITGSDIACKPAVAPCCFRQSSIARFSAAFANGLSSSGYSPSRVRWRGYG